MRCDYCCDDFDDLARIDGNRICTVCMREELGQSRRWIERLQALWAESYAVQMCRWRGDDGCCTDPRRMEPTCEPHVCTMYRREGDARASEIERLKEENAGLRLLLERIQHDELKAELALKDAEESLKEEREVRQALWAIASVDLTKEELDEWACGLDERVKAVIEQMRRSI